MQWGDKFAENPPLPKEKTLKLKTKKSNIFPLLDILDNKNKKLIGRSKSTKITVYK